MENPKIGLDTIVCQATGMVAADMEGEKVMMSLEQGDYYGLDIIGSRIWELLEQPQAVHTLIITLLAEYEVGEEQCREHVLEFMNKLYREGIVVLA